MPIQERMKFEQLKNKERHHTHAETEYWLQQYKLFCEELVTASVNCIDYQKILVVYINHVGEQEGIDFLTHMSAKDLALTQPEFDALMVAARSSA